MAGTQAHDSLAHKFYYHIPDPSVPYVDSNLKNYGKDAYKQEVPAYNYDYSQYPK